MKNTFKSIDSYKDILNKFYFFENKFDLFNLKLKNIFFWDYIRESVVFFEIYLYYHNRSKDFYENKKINNFLIYIFDIYLFFSYQIKYLFNNKKYDIIIHNSDQILTKIDNKYVHQRTYFFIKEISKFYKVLIIDSRTDILRSKKNYKCDVITSRSWHIFDVLKSYLISFTNKEKSILINLSNEIDQYFKINFKMQNKIENYLKRKLIEYKRYDKIFKKFKPKIYLYVDNGSRKSILNAAKKNNVKSIDIQHSNISIFNPIYTYQKLSKKIYSPDYIFIWGKHWKQKIINKSNKITVGYPFFELNYRKYYSNENKENLIVFISDRPSQEIQSKIALELSKKLSNFKIYFKLRLDQNHLAKKIINFNNKKIKNLYVSTDNDPPIYEYLNKSKFAFGTGSTLLLEAMVFGNQIISIPVFGCLDLIDFIENNQIKIYENVEDTVEYIKNEKGKFKLKKEEYFSNSFADLLPSINKIINE